MSYIIEGKDIVVRGFQDGIADSPYEGISDMRNCEIVSIPQEASVGFAPTLQTTQATITGATFTASSSSGILITWAGGTAIANNTAITVSNSGGGLPGNLSANTAYYVINSTATTFQLATNANGSAIAFSSSGTGTNTFTTIIMAQVKFFTFCPLDGNYFCVDTKGRVWLDFHGTTQWVYTHNIADESTAGTNGSGNGLVWVYSYVFVFGTSTLDYLNDNGSKTLAFLTTFSNWSGNSQPWKTLNNTSGAAATVPHNAIVSANDGTMYFCDGSYLGSLQQIAGTTFDPTSSSTYSFTEKALALPTTDTAQCICELGTNLLIGGALNAVYVWNRIVNTTTGGVQNTYYTIIFISEPNIVQLVSVNTNAYIFTGQRGRIYITNGSQAQIFKKVPDHLSGTVNPYYTWGGAVSNRNQLYFGVQATDNAGNAINNYGGTWAIDLDTKALRLSTQQSYGTYAGITSALFVQVGINTNNGTGLLMGWYTSSNTTGGIDVSSSSPYTGGQSYVDTDLLPVGTYLDQFTPSQIEWKTSVPIGLNGTSETVAIYYRKLFSDAYTLLGTTSSTTGQISDYYPANFQNTQWLQVRAVLTSNATTPTYCRLIEIRIRNYPSGNQGTNVSAYKTQL